MEITKELRLRSHLLFIGQVLAAVLFMILFLFPASTAEANVMDKIKGLYDLPGDVESLKKQYENTKQQLEDQKAKLEEQKDKLADTMQKAKETEDRLTSRNNQLQEENKTLQTRLQDMEQSVIQAKNKRVHQLKIAVITITSLMVLYFVLGRLFRYLIWQRNKKQEH
jgi:septal ring factor EnvC (AmiA/AmiB activator)